MSEKETFSNSPVGIQKISGSAKECDDAFGAIISEIIKTREVRQLLISIVPEFLDVWADNSFWKKTVSKVTSFTVKKQLSKTDDALEKNELTAIFENEEFIKNLGEILPDVINQTSDIVSAVFQNFENLSVEDKAEIVESLLSRTSKGQTGAILTSFARILNQVHDAHPQFLADRIEPGLRKWFEAADFGEFKEAIDKSEKGIFALAEVVNETIWDYPSKVIGIFSFVPSFVNILTGVVNISTEKVNAVPPDLLTDIIISLLNEVNGKSVAVMVNELTEIARKLTIGSALLGEAGTPQLPIALSAKLEEIITNVDPVIFWKGRIALSQLKASFDDSLAEAAGDKVEFVRLSMLKGPELNNISYRSKNKKLSILEQLDDDEFVKVMGGGLSAYDVQEAAEVFNNSLRNLNRLLEQEPQVFTDVAGQFLNAVDTDELAFTTQTILENSSEDLRAVTRSILPNLVEWACDVLKPEDDEYEDNAARARKALASLFIPEEV